MYIGAARTLASTCAVAAAWSVSDAHSPLERRRAQVDDLDEGRGSEYVDRSHTFVMFVSAGYFQSPNCMRELLRARLKDKPIVAL